MRKFNWLLVMLIALTLSMGVMIACGDDDDDDDDDSSSGDDDDDDDSGGDWGANDCSVICGNLNSCSSEFGIPIDTAECIDLCEDLVDEGRDCADCLKGCLYSLDGCMDAVLCVGQCGEGVCAAWVDYLL